MYKVEKFPRNLYVALCSVTIVIHKRRPLKCDTFQSSMQCFPCLQKSRKPKILCMLAKITKAKNTLHVGEGKNDERKKVEQKFGAQGQIGETVSQTHR